MKLTYVRLLVDDFGACFRFYRDVMGFSATFGDEDSGYADFGVGVDATLEELRGRGAPLSADPSDRRDWGIRVAYVRDPDGNLIELNQPILEEAA